MSRVDHTCKQSSLPNYVRIVGRATHATRHSLTPSSRNPTANEKPLEDSTHVTSGQNRSYTKMKYHREISYKQSMSTLHLDGIPHVLDESLQPLRFILRQRRVLLDRERFRERRERRSAVS